MDSAIYLALADLPDIGETRETQASIPRLSEENATWRRGGGGGGGDGSGVGVPGRWLCSGK